MKIRKVGRKATINLFGKRIILLPCAEAGFNVSNWNTVVVRAEGGGKGRGRVPLYKHQARAFVAEDPVEPRYARRRHVS